MKRSAAFIDSHLLVCLTLAFITGIAVAPLLGPTASVIRQVGSALFTFVLCLAALSYGRKREAVFCLLLPFMVGVGFYSAQVHLQVPPQDSHIFHRIEIKTEAVIVGTLSAMPTFDGESSQLCVAAEYLRRADDQDLQAATGKVLLRMKGPWPENLVPGDRLAVRATVKRPDGGRSPGVFDYARYLAEKDIWITGFIRSAVHLHRLEETPSQIRSLRYFPERLRTKIGERIDAAVAGATRGIYRAILIGDYSQVDDATMEAFKGSGTLHILSVSGLHMAVIGSFLYLSIYWLLSRSEWLLLRYPVRKIAAFLSLPVLVFYSLLAGMNTPVLRAVIMSGLVIVALCTDRRKSPSTLLAFAAMLILVVDPLQLFTASFQLSFAAVLAILFLYPALQKIVLPDGSRPSPTIRGKIVNWLVAGLLVSVVATLATAPITLYFFNRFSTVGIVANLVVEPLICLWSLPAGFVAIPLLFIAPELSDLCFVIGSIGLDGALYAVRFFAALPGATLWLPSPAMWQMLLYLTALFGITYFTARKSSSIVRGLPILLGLFLLMIFAPRLIAPKPPDSLQVTFLDVGQGSSTLLQYPSGMNILIDGGGPAYGSKGSPSVGERTIAPLLWHEGIGKLDAIVITHPDADHYNGLDFIVKHFSPSALWVRDTAGHDNSFKQLMELATDRKIRVVVPEKGQQLGSDGGYLECVENLAAERIPATPAENRQNANSGLVLKACGSNLCTLFPGDIGMNEERSLAGFGYDLAADFLLAPHHGSSTSNSSEFITAVSPRVILVSAGRAGGGHFPHQHLIDECERRGIPLITTSRWGTLHLVTGKESYRIWGYDRPDYNPLRPFQPVLLKEGMVETPGEKNDAILSGTKQIFR
ncbi:MAG: hypothetical protein ACD_75C00716G0001 [uncultured bacterium]|nr:MAG: hypothetical protein ACD_75C00716G0001 [uncultured bacterium]